MPQRKKETIECQICNRRLRPDEVIPGDLVREGIQETIRKKYPSWDPSGYVCLDDLNQFRVDYVQDVLETERGELSSLELDVVHSLEQEETLAKDVGREFESKLTMGQRSADKLASFVGSWTFILSFMGILAIWVALNATALIAHWDPYPFILLNLVLSCIAAIQAPIIMMSQNRQEARDRARDEQDARVNLKAELEIRHLHAKLDQLMTHQWQRMIEMQGMQLELLSEQSMLAKEKPAR